MPTGLMVKGVPQMAMLWWVPRWDPGAGKAREAQAANAIASAAVAAGNSSSGRRQRLTRPPFLCPPAPLSKTPKVR
jgi:hypothetical protein